MIPLYLSDQVEPQTTDWWSVCAPFMKPIEASPSSVTEPSLWLTAEGLKLLDPQHRTPFQIPLAEFRRHAGARSMLCRACGVAGSRFRVLDLFAGFGIDGLALAQHADVTLVEKSPLVFALLSDAVERAGVVCELVYADGLKYLGEDTGADVIYLDPMFPLRSKKALPGRSMQHLQQLQSLTPMSQENLARLVLKCLDVAADRVVLKRRAKDPVIGAPNHSVKGRTIRFDVYR